MQHKDTVHLSEKQKIHSSEDSAEILKFSRTLERVTARTIELAGLDGRPAHQISQGDYERAKLEIAAMPNT